MRYFWVLLGYSFYMFCPTLLLTGFYCFFIVRSHYIQSLIVEFALHSRTPVFHLSLATKKTQKTYKQTTCWQKRRRRKGSSGGKNEEIEQKNKLNNWSLTSSNLCNLRASVILLINKFIGDCLNSKCFIISHGSSRNSITLQNMWSYPIPCVL